MLATLEFVPLVCTSSHPFDLETRARVLIGNEAVTGGTYVHRQKFLNDSIILRYNSTDVIGCYSKSEPRMGIHISRSVML